MHANALGAVGIPLCHFLAASEIGSPLRIATDPCDCRIMHNKYGNGWRRTSGRAYMTYQTIESTSRLQAKQTDNTFPTHRPTESSYY